MNAAVLKPAPDHLARSAGNEDSPIRESGAPLSWQSGFAALGPGFYTELLPEPLPEPYWVGQSAQVAALVGLTPAQMQSSAMLDAFTGNTLLPGSKPLASVYSGHQFGQWAGQLGDGRAILLGEAAPPGGATSGTGWEIQLKGAGRTPYSRMGDGRAVLRSSIREFLGSEAMHGLGIPTSRALCVTGSDARVRREEIETAAVVTRVAPSFVRFGHFEHFSYNDQLAHLKSLADYVIERYYGPSHDFNNFVAPEKGEIQPSIGDSNPYATLLRQVSERTAAMVAQWQSVGFCHGVMNTDNMSVLGLTIDYGPFQFMDAYVPGHICNHSDSGGRYAFNKQPNIAYWNLYALGQALLPLMGEGAQARELAVAALESYKTVFPAAFEARMRAKLGLADAQPGDRTLVENTLKLLAKERVDFTIFWHRLSKHIAGDSQDPVRDLFLDRDAFDAWMLPYSERLNTISRDSAGQLMLQSNPKYVLRNHLGEEAIRKARVKDFTMVKDLLAVLERPFDEHPAFEAWAGFPPEWAAGIEISCSS